MLSADPGIRRLMALRAVESGLLRLKWLAAATRFELAMRRHDRALKYNFNPNQPRVPRGNPDGGQWTYVPGWSSSDRGDDGGGEQRVPPPKRIRLAGEIPTGDPPEIPKERPPTTRQRNAIVRGIARRLGPYIWIAVEAGSWIYDHKEEINSYFDPPKSLEELQKAASHPEKGYDVHHIVERNTAAKDGSEDHLIDAPENLVRVPRWKHWQINSWFQMKTAGFGGLSPRRYLRGKSWEERRKIGLDALREVGVLR
jgi:hypothetical protein